MVMPPGRGCAGNVVFDARQRAQQARSCRALSGLCLRFGMRFDDCLLGSCVCVRTRDGLRLAARSGALLKRTPAEQFGWLYLVQAQDRTVNMRALQRAYPT